MIRAAQRRAAAGRAGAEGQETDDWRRGFHYAPFAPELRAYIDRIDAARLDEKALTRVGAELCADPG